MFMTTLDNLKPGMTGVITKVGGDGSVKRRMIDMGLVSGTSVQIVKYAPLGDPMEVKVKNFNLSLRKTEAALVGVQVKDEKEVTS